jgi:hypothetical protein
VKFVSEKLSSLFPVRVLSLASDGSAALPLMASAAKQMQAINIKLLFK